MIRSMWAAASGMQAQSLNIDVIANNLANVTTTGFKRSRAEFQDLLYETLRAPGASSSESTEVPTGIQIGHGTRPVSVAKNFTEGELQLTKNQLDLAIEGEGFFQVTQPNGETAYTRAGAFKLDREGRIVTADGFLLDPQISVPTDAVSITVGMDGTVSVLQAGDAAPREIGSIQLARFVNPAGLQSIGKNLLLPTEASGDALTGTPGEGNFGQIAQGFLEMSNVNVVDEMVNMITAQRAYETNSKVVQTSDDMLQVANNLKR
ncbi:MAG: flagellar basal-body rod protein FlgG [Desulfobacterales bacterium]|nr:flagellar basal-body rod protein FlgG [Desulfobacterales bacterium]MCU0585325.1 flagellar basal-body rod protein FlgG [Desulfobacterales bacterium]